MPCLPGLPDTALQYNHRYLPGLCFSEASKDHEKLIRSIFEPYKAAELYICRNISGKRPDEKQTESDRLQDISEVLPAEPVRKS